MTQLNQKELELLCPICGNSGYEVLFSARDADRLKAEPFEVVRCTDCELVSTRPFLSDEAQGIWYRAKYHGWWKGIKWHPLHVITGFLQGNRFRFVNRHMQEGSRLMDIGCGDGTFIKYMESRGFEVWGVENPGLFPRSGEGDTDMDMKGLDVGTGPGGEVVQFDIVTVWHALEHVEDPLSVLRRAHDALKTSGRLIISVPNFKSLQSVLCRGKWFHLDLPRHRWHFCPETMAGILQKSGFTITHIAHFSLEYSPFGWMQSLMNLCCCSHNFLYNLLKRRESPFYARSSLKKLYDMFCAIVLGSVFAPVSFVLSVLESSIHRGGAITVVGKKTEVSG